MPGRKPFFCLRAQFYWTQAEIVCKIDGKVTKMEFIHNAVTDAMLQRRSIRSYTEEKLTEDEIHTNLTCGLWAPSARNHQTTRFAVVQDAELLQQLSGELLEGVEKPSRWMENFYYHAPCVIFAYDLADDRWTAVNAAIAAENMHVAAHSLGLGSVLIGIIREFMQSERGEYWKKRLGIPSDYIFTLALAVGHPAEEGRPLPRKEENIIYVEGNNRP